MRLLLPGDERSAFHCGDLALDRYFREFAGQNQFRHYLGANYVALDDGHILGFATVSSAQVDAAALPAALRRKLPHYPVPVLRLARLATDSAGQGRGVGLLLLRYVLRLAVAQRHTVGCVGVVVDAKPAAVSFYARYGFAALAEEPGGVARGLTPMFLAMPTVIKAMQHR